MPKGSNQKLKLYYLSRTGVRIVSPEDVVERFREEIKEIANAYAARV